MEDHSTAAGSTLALVPVEEVERSPRTGLRSHHYCTGGSPVEDIVRIDGCLAGG